MSFVPPYIRLDGPEHAWSGPTRWSYPPHEADWVLSCDGPSHVSLHTPDGIEQQWDDPLAALQWMSDNARAQNSPQVRWVGYLSYELGRLFEQVPTHAVDDLALPLYRFSLQYLKGEPQGYPPHAADPPAAPALVRSTFDRRHYLAAVARAIEYVAAGDVFQVNLSQRFSTDLREHPARLYARLRRQAPAWYGACLCYDDFAVVSNSPELFLRVEPRPDGSRQVITRPIKGTRPRLPGMERELRDSLKDQAELNMIIDLERNDLGRVCEIGSVRVAEPRTIEAHPTVYHGVATVEGTLRPDVTFADLLRATFPGGSVTGAPKIRAMEIIEELEPVRRGPYCGAIGYLSGDGSIEFNVAIRTMTARDGVVHVPVGGGIVADSDPAAEYEETIVKARAMFDALGVRPETLPR